MTSLFTQSHNHTIFYKAMYDDVSTYTSHLFCSISLYFTLVQPPGQEPLLLLEHAKHTPSLGALHSLFCPFGRLLPQINMICFLTSFRCCVNVTMCEYF